MANYLPFNSIDADRAVKAEDWAWYFSTFISNGIFPEPSDGLQVVANGDMTVSVKAGYGFINGYAFKADTETIFTIATGDGVLARIDRAVLRWDLDQRMMLLAVLEGTPSASPTAPALTRTADIYELALADIAVAVGATSLTQSAITDDRYNTDLCGICAGVIDQIDPSTITSQFTTYFAEMKESIDSDYTDYTANIEYYESDWRSTLNAWLAAQQASFASWFDSMKGQLSQDAAGQLQLELDAIDERLTDLEDQVARNRFKADMEDDDGTAMTDDDGAVMSLDFRFVEM